MRSFVIALLLLVAAGSARAQGPVRIADTRMHEQWYREMEACLGIKGDLYGVTFYADSSGRHPVTRVRFNGYHEPGSIILYYKKANDRLTVMHEIIHDITHSRGNEHPRKYFQNKCGDFSLGELLDG